MQTCIQDELEISQVLEDNILALLDTVGVKDANDIEDDRMSFIEAVYALSIAAHAPRAPTWKVHEAIFQILDGNFSLVLNLSSYSLLVELSDQYPHVLVRDLTDEVHGLKKELVLNKKIWSPFKVSHGVEDKSKGGLSTRHTHSTESELKEFTSVLQAIQSKIGPWDVKLKGPLQQSPEFANEKTIGLLLKFKYLFSLLERDFICRLEVFKFDQKRETLSNSLLVQLFKGSNQKKELAKQVLHLLAACGLYREGISTLDLNDFCLSLERLLEMCIAFDVEMARRVPASPRKGKQDVSSLSMLEVIGDIISGADMYEAFLQALTDSDLKLKIIFHNFLRHIPMPMKRDMIDKPNKWTVQELLNYFSNHADVKRIYKVIDTEILQIFLANAFKVGLKQAASDEITPATLELCKSLRTAFINLRAICSDLDEVHVCARQALIIAEQFIRFADCKSPDQMFASLDQRPCNTFAS